MSSRRCLCRLVSCACHLSRSGEVVSREEVRQEVWPDDTFVDFDHNLNTAINKIREVREAAQESWSNFRTDPEWQRAAEESRRDGRLVTNVDSVFLDPTDFSPMR